MTYTANFFSLKSGLLSSKAGLFDSRRGFFDSRGQFKIQQMAFVLVAIMIFFAIAALFYFSIRVENLRESAESLNEGEARELVRKLSGTPEFSFSGCVNCVDLDKVLMLKERRSYEKFWELEFLRVEKVYPENEGECTRANYPACKTITITESENFGAPSSAFVSLCRWENEKGGYFKCELGRIYASGLKNLS